MITHPNYSLNLTILCSPTRIKHLVENQHRSDDDVIYAVDDFFHQEDGHSSMNSKMSVYLGKWM